MNNGPSNPLDSANTPSPPESTDRSTVHKVHGVLRIKPPEPATQGGPYNQQGAPPQGAWQRICPHCQGGNPPGAVVCQWCRLPLDGPPVANRPPSPTLLAAYREVLRHPSAESMASEIPGASWGRIWLGLGVSTLFSTLAQWLFRVILVSYIYVPMFNQAMASSGTGGVTGTGGLGGTSAGTFSPMPAAMSNFVFSILDLMQSPLVALAQVVFTIAGFFLSALLLYGLSRAVGGAGHTGKFGPDFKVLSYLLSLEACPVAVVVGVVGFIPFVGSIGAIAIIVYTFILQYFALRASMQLTTGKAQTVILLQIGIGFVLSFVVSVVGMIVFLTTVFSQFRQSVIP